MRHTIINSVLFGGTLIAMLYLVTGYINQNARLHNAPFLDANGNVVKYKP